MIYLLVNDLFLFIFIKKMIIYNFIFFIKNRKLFFFSKKVKELV